jgi:hypothetical protein
MICGYSLIMLFCRICLAVCLAWLLSRYVACCAVPCCAALYPIDTIKTRLQAMIGGGGFKALMSSGGGKGLYAGVWGNLAGVLTMQGAGRSTCISWAQRQLPTYTRLR